MKDTTRAYFKVARGYATAANAVASAAGYGVLSFVTGNHHRTPLAMRMAAISMRSAQETIRDGKADLARAKRNV